MKQGIKSIEELYQHLEEQRENRKDITVNGVSTFWAVDYNQTEWPVLEPGENTIKVTTNASGEGPEISLTHGMLYEGV